MILSFGYYDLKIFAYGGGLWGKILRITSFGVGCKESVLVGLERGMGMAYHRNLWGILEIINYNKTR